MSRVSGKFFLRRTNLCDLST